MKGRDPEQGDEAKAAWIFTKPASSFFWDALNSRQRVRVGARNAASRPGPETALEVNAASPCSAAGPGGEGTVEALQELQVRPRMDKA